MITASRKNSEAHGRGLLLGARDRGGIAAGRPVEILPENAELCCHRAFEVQA